MNNNSPVSSKPRPRLGCAVVVRKDNKILLGVRGKEPNMGKWILPGGGVNFLEHFWLTAKREIMEETGLEIDTEKVIGVYEIITPPDEHRVIIYVWANYKAGEIKPASDLLDAKFLSKEEIHLLFENGSITEIVTRVLKDIGWL